MSTDPRGGNRSSIQRFAPGMILRGFFLQVSRRMKDQDLMGTQISLRTLRVPSRAVFILAFSSISRLGGCFGTKVRGQVHAVASVVSTLKSSAMGEWLVDGAGGNLETW